MPKLLPERAPTAILIWANGLNCPPQIYVNGGSYEADAAILAILEKVADDGNE